MYNRLKANYKHLLIPFINQIEAMKNNQSEKDAIAELWVTRDKQKEYVWRCIFDIKYEYESFCYNLDITALGVFLHKVGEILNNDLYIKAAYRQLDWMLGFNRFDVSNVEGAGYNQPHRCIFGEFFPPVPQIPGGVFVGFSEHSFSEEAYGFDNEYDMPMVGWLMYLLEIIKKQVKYV